MFQHVRYSKLVVGMFGMSQRLVCDVFLVSCQLDISSSISLTFVFPDLGIVNFQLGGLKWLYFKLKATIQLGDHSFQIGGRNVWDFIMILWDVVRCYFVQSTPSQALPDPGRSAQASVDLQTRQTRADQGR